MHQQDNVITGPQGSQVQPVQAVQAPRDLGDLAELAALIESATKSVGRNFGFAQAAKPKFLQTTTGMVVLVAGGIAVGVGATLVVGHFMGGSDASPVKTAK